MSNSVEQLYKYYGILADAGSDMYKHEDCYRHIIQASKGDLSERRLACQFIPRFFKGFPNLGEAALNSLFDLCEDELVSIRKQVTKELPRICKDCSVYTKKTAYVICQMLQTTDPSELQVVINSLYSIVQYSPEGAIAGIFQQIRTGEDTVRDKCISFLMSKIKPLPNKVTELENALINEIKGAFYEASPDEIPILMDLLFSTRLGNDISGHIELVNMVAEQIESDSPFNVEDNDLIERFLVLCKSVKSLFKPTLSPKRLITFCCKEIFPQFKKVEGYEECSGYALELLRVFAELTIHCNELVEPKVVVEAVYDLLIEVMPYSENDQYDLIDTKLHFSYIECLLFSFHKLFKLHRRFLTKESDLSRFRARLQYFSRALQGYIKTLNNSIKNETAETLKLPENEIKILALKTTLNINNLIKDFFYNPPANKAVVQLSWTSSKECESKKILMNLKRLSNNNGVDVPTKRRNIKTSRSVQRQIYQPPNGKYSKSFCKYVAKNSYLPKTQ